MASQSPAGRCSKKYAGSKRTLLLLFPQIGKGKIIFRWKGELCFAESAGRNVLTRESEIKHSTESSQYIYVVQEPVPSSWRAMPKEFIVTNPLLRREGGTNKPKSRNQLRPIFLNDSYLYKQNKTKTKRFDPMTRRETEK